MHPGPELTAAERAFLLAWIWDEAHPRTPPGDTAKKTQIEKAPYAAPLLADLAAATLTAEEQRAAAHGPGTGGNPPWPWASEAALRTRHQAARAWLEHRRRPRPISGPDSKGPEIPETEAPTRPG